MDNLSELLADDDAIEEMSAKFLKDAYVRMKLWKAYHEKYLKFKYGAESMNNPECERAMQALEHGNMAAVGMWLSRDGRDVFRKSLIDAAVSNLEVAPVALYDELVDQPDEEMLPKIRDQLKTSLRSCGMPRTKIARAVVKNAAAAREGDDTSQQERVGA